MSYVGDYAFSKCTYLRALNGNSLSVKAVGMYAFAGCSLISKMTFDGDVVSSIGYGAFSKTSLKVLSFTFESPDADKCRQAVVLATGFNEDSN